MNKVKKKNHNISIDAEKGLYQTQHAFLKKFLCRQGLDQNFLSPIKDISDRPTADSTLSGFRLNESLQVELGTRMFTLTTSTQHCSGGSSQGNKARKINKTLQVWRGRSTTVVTDNITASVENTIEYIKKLLELICEVSKIAK